MSVRLAHWPTVPSEQTGRGTDLDEHHWLGHRLVGEGMRYVALSGDGEWLVLVGFGASVLASRQRDRFIGGSDEVYYRRLCYANTNHGLCNPPANG